MHSHQGSPAMPPAKDLRAVIALTPAERAMVLQEMRMFLDGVEKITTALAAEDMKAVVTAAKPMGMRMMRDVPMSLREKLPMGFRELGSGTHRDFDQLAAEAEGLGDPKHTLKQLGVALQKCTACHATFRIENETPGKAKR